MGYLIFNKSFECNNSHRLNIEHLQATFLYIINKSSAFYLVVPFPDKTIEQFVHIFNNIFCRRLKLVKFGESKRFNDLNSAEWCKTHHIKSFFNGRKNIIEVGILSCWLMVIKIKS